MLKKILFILALLTFTYCKLSVELQNKLPHEKTENVIVLLKEFMDFEKHVHEGKLLMSYKPDQRAKIIVETLMKIQQNSQQEIQKYLTSLKISFKSFWISNSLLITQPLEKSLILLLSQRPDVQYIGIEPTLSEIPLIEEPKSSNSLEDYDWHIKWINAQPLRDRGFRGQGITIGFMDTGLSYKIPALERAYRGYLGPNKWDHNYNWGGTENEPFDRSGHGTAVSGAAVGGYVGKDFGVANQSRIIHCSGLGLSGCAEWHVAPKKLDGTQPDVKKKADIVSISLGTGGLSNLCRSFNALTASGTAVVIAAGNWGPECSTVSGMSVCPDMISVGALQKNSDTIARFSSRGPNKFVTERLDPSLSAPGSGVWTCNIRGTYGAISGTSIATPVISGAIAVLWSAVPKLKGDVKLTNRILTQSAKRQVSDECGSKGSPNYTYGYGTINIQRAYQLAVQYFKENKD